MQYYDTLSEAVQGLKSRGYIYDFELHADALSCEVLDATFGPNDFSVVEVHRFEGMSSVDDSAVLYAIETEAGKKGTLVDAYGAYAENLTPEMAKRMQMHRNG